VTYPMETATTKLIRSLLDERNIPYKYFEHAPTPTSEESAKVRGESIAIGGKALLLKVDDAFELFVVSAALRLDTKALCKFRNAKRSRFATKEELFEFTGLVPGSVPPFGNPILPFPLFVDHSVTANEKIAFNAGSLTASITMAVVDYLAVTNPVVARFSLS
jgi:Ala-tRNA(Pro) deacylase